MNNYRLPKYFNIRDPFPDDIKLSINECKLSFHRKYARKEKVGSGGFGLVYHGINKFTDEKVVLKFIKANAVPVYGVIDGTVMPMEAVLLYKTKDCKGTVNIIELFKFDIYWIIVMPRENPKVIDLYDYIGEKTKLSESHAAFILHQLIGILLYCHHRGILHRDIKDENILIDKDSLIIKLIDFGSGTLLKRDKYDDFDGTRVYCPPEWLVEKKYDGLKAEVWTIGVLLYDMVCGDVPFTNDTQILSGKFAYKRIEPSLNLDELIKSCLERDPKLRPSLGQILTSKWMRRYLPIKYQSEPKMEYAFVNLWKENMYFEKRHGAEYDAIMLETWITEVFASRPYSFYDAENIHIYGVHWDKVTKYLEEYERYKNNNPSVELQVYNYQEINRKAYTLPFEYYQNVLKKYEKSSPLSREKIYQGKELTSINIQKPFCDMDFVKENVC